jgi:hypothetical protein
MIGLPTGTWIWIAAGVLLLPLPQFLFHGSPFFLRILAPAG